MTAIPAQGSPGSTFAGPHFGHGNLPAGCVVDRDPLNPDNFCYHQLVGLNALDSPKVDVDVLVPVSPTAERDMRVADQAVDMWDGGLHYLAGQMDLPWLKSGFDMNVRTHEVPVTSDGTLVDPLNLVDPEIVVVLSNPAGGIGIGVDPSNLVSQLGITNGEGVPCVNVPDPFDYNAWLHKPGFREHDDEPGGIYVQDCGGVGGNVCFAVNGAIDPLPGESDFFPEFDLVAHEFGHCLTLGHVGDGADGPWGPTPTNDIMAYSTDPPNVNKCVSTLDVETFALRMSHYLDVNGDGKVDKADTLEPNDPKGDGTHGFEVQNPADHHYASRTGLPGDCPQADESLIPGVQQHWSPTPVETTTPQLQLAKVRRTTGGLVIAGTAARVPMATQPTRHSGAVTDKTGDSLGPITDIHSVRVKVTSTAVDATMTVGRVWPVADGTSATAYSLLVSGRRLDSFIGTGTTTGTPVLLDNGTGYYLPEGNTVTWDKKTNTVHFHVRRDYLADQQIRAPYQIFGETGLHARSNDWIASEDYAPNSGGLRLAGPAMGPETRDVPKATSSTTKKLTLHHAGGQSFVAADSTLGVGLISTVDTRHYLTLPIHQQATAKVTLTWDDPASSLGLSVNGGSGQKIVSKPGSVTVTVPWARRDLAITVDPEQIVGEPQTHYELSATVRTVVADRDHDGVPDVADACRSKAGPSDSAGCPDTDHDGTLNRFDRCPLAAGIGEDGCPTAADERVVVLVDGHQAAIRYVMTRHGDYAFRLAVPLSPKAHQVRIQWYDGTGKVIATRTLPAAADA